MFFPALTHRPPFFCKRLLYWARFFDGLFPCIRSFRITWTPHHPFRCRSFLRCPPSFGDFRSPSPAAGSASSHNVGGCPPTTVHRAVFFFPRVSLVFGPSSVARLFRASDSSAVSNKLTTANGALCRKELPLALLGYRVDGMFWVMTPPTLFFGGTSAPPLKDPLAALFPPRLAPMDSRIVRMRA